VRLSTSGKSNPPLRRLTDGDRATVKPAADFTLPEGMKLEGFLVTLCSH